jgi:hypothetical protein
MISHPPLALVRRGRRRSWSSSFVVVVVVAVVLVGWIKLYSNQPDDVIAEKL